MGFNFEIQNKKGASNKVADALSHRSVEGYELGSITSTCVFPLEAIYQEIEQDPSFGKQSNRYKISLCRKDYITREGW